LPAEYEIFYRRCQARTFLEEITQFCISGYKHVLSYVATNSYGHLLQWLKPNFTQNNDKNISGFQGGSVPMWILVWGGGIVHMQVTFQALQIASVSPFSRRKIVWISERSAMQPTSTPINIILIRMLCGTGSYYCYVSLKRTSETSIFARNQ
jgi:hypothetical protein